MFTQFSLGVLTSAVFSFAIYHSIRDRKHLKVLGQYHELKKALTESEYQEVFFNEFIYTDYYMIINYIFIFNNILSFLL